jgi:hypothetical protein
MTIERYLESEAAIIIATVKEKGASHRGWPCRVVSRWSNRGHFPYNYAAVTMRVAGYIPFQGFPLQRIKKVGVQ